MTLKKCWENAGFRKSGLMPVLQMRGELKLKKLYLTHSEFIVI